ncbi:ELIP2 [Auxenochlorella protothecoides x Auxenochlorella symbiontica]
MFATITPTTHSWSASRSLPLTGRSGVSRPVSTLRGVCVCVSNNQFPKGQKPASKDSVATQAVKDVPIVRPTAPTSTTPLAPLDPNESKLPLPETKPSNKKSLWEAMRFDGPAPERINGRLAMLAVITGVLEELRSGHGIIWQAQHPNPLIAVSFLAIIYASLVPILKGAVYEDFGIFTVVAEKLNGRAAMIGFASLLALEVVRQGALFGSI